MEKIKADKKCTLEVIFKDTDEQEHTTTIEHNGDDDCWDGCEIDNKAFDFNTFDDEVYGTGEGHIKVAGYQCTEKNKKGEWIINCQNEIEILSVKEII